MPQKTEARSPKSPSRQTTFGSISQMLHVGVSKNRGTPKWMVKTMENPIKMDDLGVTIIFLETPIYLL